MVRPDGRIGEGGLGGRLGVDVAEEAGGDGTYRVEQTRMRESVVGRWEGEVSEQLPARTNEERAPSSVELHELGQTTARHTSC